MIVDRARRTSFKVSFVLNEQCKLVIVYYNVKNYSQYLVDTFSVKYVIVAYKLIKKINSIQ